MNATDLAARATKILHSSAYAPGDQLTFKVLLDAQTSLPAPSDPDAYMADVKAKLKFTLPKAGRICVVGAGYGGLASYFLAQGASQVVVIEPRFRYFAGLDQIVALLDEIHSPQQAETIKTFKAWPQPGHEQSLGQFDLVICPEGFDECPEPVQALTALLMLVKPNGGLVLEVACGETTSVPAGKVNSWRPTKETVANLLRKINNSEVLREAQGRLVGRYLLATVPQQPQVPEIKQVPFSEPFPLPIQRSAPTPVQAPAPPPPPPPPPAPVQVAPDATKHVAASTPEPEIGFAPAEAPETPDLTETTNFYGRKKRRKAEKSEEKAEMPDEQTDAL